MFDKALAIVNLVYQVGDFLVKAVVAYSQTSQGETEWADVQAALLAIGVLDAPPMPTSAGNETEQSFSIGGQRLQTWDEGQLREELARQARERDGEPEDYPEGVTRNPRKHGGSG